MEATMMGLERTVVIVGAGFCGTAVAVNLLRLASAGATDMTVVLVDRAEATRGAAYRSREYPYLLNVPAGRMSLSSVDPTGFVEFSRRRLPEAGADDFLPRELYGAYLEATLRAAELASPMHVRLVRLRGDAIRIERAPSGRAAGLRVRLGDGRVLLADDVVLALGNPPPAPLPGAERLAESPRYVPDPWAEPLAFEPGETVLIAGTGLTMADVAAAAAERTGRRIVLHAISRRGLLPPAQTIFHAAQALPDATPAIALLKAAARSTRRLVRAVRDLCEATERAGGDWREPVTLVRHLAPDLWWRMPHAERQRFLRHVRSYWDIHRHRLPDRSLATLHRLRETDKLHIHAGRIVELAPDADGIRAEWRARGSDELQRMHVDRVINCTGPDHDVRRSTDPLIRSLLSDGLAVRDPLGLGLRTGDRGALIDAHGHAARDLHYIGPLLRADRWEATAVPELREHAERLAHHLSVSREPRVPACERGAFGALG
jgi:uncharacterized NAD(P)/FAD-binding protein YdhS